MKKATIFALIIYIGAIVLANYLITHGCPGATATPFGTYTLPVGFGLTAPAGIYAAAIALPSRDVVQRTAGRTVGFVAIIVGALVSYVITDNATIALASAVAFAASEVTDMVIFTPLQSRNLGWAVVAAGVPASLVDALIFLAIAGLPLSGVWGLTVGKCWVVLAAAPIIHALRKMIPAS